ncbi:putative 3-demethylubiquinone-9 3-methyltransferase (glyoxalase superfamily) [Paraburkholderia sp. GAS333]|uniref:VOC family protein n=1 Tax=Paraburkholderia sp. GAS333 TaxID=3156279 RepID=UPI003D23602D
MQKIAPCLWFNGNAEEAAEFYMSVFSASRIVTTMHYPEAGPGPKGKVLAITFEIEGQEFMALNGGPQFTFTPAISLFVHCASQEEVDRYWTKLTEGGGSPWQCGWLKDRFGISWQIVPDSLGDMLRDPDDAKASRVMAAMMKMVKLDLAQLERAYRGE